MTEPLILSGLVRVSQQKITINPDGSMSGLEYKPGKGVDMKALGDADVKRATDIEWDAGAKAWKVKWLDFNKEGYMTYSEYARGLSHYLANEFAYKTWKMMADMYAFTDPEYLSRPALFASYEDAVVAEIDTIEGLGLKPVRSDT